MVPETFTAYMSSQYYDGYTLPLKPFSIDKNFAGNATKAITLASTEKATGTDEIFVEALKLEPEKRSK